MKNLGNYECDGQINLMDLLIPENSENEPPVMLTEGQRVYKVIRGDVKECIVGKRTWSCGHNNRGYDLDRDVTWNTQIGRVVFTEREPAESAAARYLAENDHILGKDIHATEVVAYKYICHDREIINFYAALVKGEIYYRYGSMYEHIGKAKEIKKFEEDRRNHIDSGGYKELNNYQPVFANMYKCKHDSWLYAAAQYESFNFG